MKNLKKVVTAITLTLISTGAAQSTPQGQSQKNNQGPAIFNEQELKQEVQSNPQKYLLKEDEQIITLINQSKEVILFTNDPPTELVNAAAQRAQQGANITLIIGQKAAERTDIKNARKKGAKIGIINSKVRSGILVTEQVVVQNGILIQEPGKTIFVRSKLQAEMTKTAINQMLNYRYQGKSAVNWIP